MIEKDEIFSESIPLPNHNATMYQTLGAGESVNRRDGLSERPPTAWDRIASVIARSWPVPNFTQVTVLVGVSGGADSVCLLRALHELFPKNAPGRLIVAHYNHQLRGPAADSDAVFVQSLASKLGLQFMLGSPGKSIADDNANVKSLHAADRYQASEESLRKERYAFFEDSAARSGARYVALAHTATDNVETVLHNLFRGSGPPGLAGIPMFRSLGTDLVVARPLLKIDRQTILDGLSEIGQSFCHDATNDTDQWNRNWLRNTLLPYVKERYPQADLAILRAAELIGQQNDDVLTLAKRFIDSDVQQTDSSIIFRQASEFFQHNESSPIASQAVGQSIFFAAASLLFDQQGWPRGSMTRNHWDALWDIYFNPARERLSAPAHLNLPGGLHVSRKADGSVVVESQRCD